MKGKPEGPKHFESSRPKGSDPPRPITLESVFNPLPPVKNSLDFIIEEFEDPMGLLLFRRDFTPSNKLSFHGMFRGRWTVKLNSFLGIGGQWPTPVFEMLDEAQLNGPVGRYDAQIKFRPARVSAQLDFGHHLMLHRTYIDKGARIDKYSFWNPYILAETDRSFHRQLYAMGAMIHSNGSFRGNFRLNLRSRDSVFGWDISANASARHNGFFASWLLNFGATDQLFFNYRRFLLSFDRRRLNLNAELSFDAGNFRQWQVNQAIFSVALDLKELGQVGLMLAPKSGTDIPTSLARRASGVDFSPPDLRHPSVDPQLTSSAVAHSPADDFALAYGNRITHNCLLKAKVSVRGDAATFFNFRIRDGLNFHVSLKTRLSQNKLKGLLDLPFEFGAKIKLEN